MERLTDIYWRNLDPWECCGQDHHCQRGCHDEGGCTNGCIVPKLYDRLAAYEDTGMTPEGITDFVKRWEDVAKLAGLCKQYGADHLAELLQAENEGRLKTDVVHCKDCKHLYFKDFEAFCPHRVGPCRPSGFCERGETISGGGAIEHGNQ